MLAAVHSAAVLGIEAYDITVEVHVARGLPNWTVVGLPAGAVKEARERVSAALANSGFAVPPRRVTINLAPADVRKDGTAFDLPIALGVLVATGQLASRLVQRLVAIAELGLDGTLRPVRGALPVARRVAEREGLTLVLAPGNVAEASLVARVRLAAPATLAELVRLLAAGSLPVPSVPMPVTVADPAPELDDVVGQDAAKRALEIAAAGGHALLMVGPPGAGKTMLARRLPGILPALRESEALEVMAIHSVAGVLARSPVGPPVRPFRAPHHSLSMAALVGGGSVPRPGEVSLSHHGVLFLDELQEIPRHVLDALRQPLEDGVVTISRASTAVRFPARFTLVGAMNPCPCGWAGDDSGRCTCAAHDIARHRARLSGPLADRIDMQVRLAAVPLRVLATAAPASETSRIVRARVEKARDLQRARYASFGTAMCNAHVPGRWLDANGDVAADARERLAAAADRAALSARAYHRVLKVARTIADLDDEKTVAWLHVAEALQYRLEATGDLRERETAEQPGSVG